MWIVVTLELTMQEYFYELKIGAAGYVGGGVEILVY